MSLGRSCLPTLIALVMAGAGCTAANPLYTPASASDLGDAGEPVIGDLSTTPGQDLAKGTADLSMPSGCSSGARTCLQEGSASCKNGAYVLDRICPQNSSCADGYCQPPPLSPGGAGKSCATATAASENICTFGANGTNPPSCAPFVEDGAASTQEIVWRCIRPVGSGFPGVACTSGSQCRSGYCGSNGTCFRACSSEPECPNSGPGNLKCADVQIVVEGVQVTAKSCIPG